MRQAILAFNSGWVAALSLAAWSGFAAETNPAVRSRPVAITNTARPTNWAVRLERPHLPNFYLVSTNLYRGAQPDAKGMAELKAMGVRTVVNLRSFHSDTDETRGLGLKLERLHMKPWHSEEEDVVAFLKMVANTNSYPIFVHCQRGADRTGLVCAMYRVTFCGWTKAEAIREMKEGGFNYDPRWKNIVNYIEQADVEDLKQKAGIAESSKR